MIINYLALHNLEFFFQWKDYKKILVIYYTNQSNIESMVSTHSIRHYYLWYKTNLLNLFAVRGNNDLDFNHIIQL